MIVDQLVILTLVTIGLLAVGWALRPDEPEHDDVDQLARRDRR